MPLNIERYYHIEVSHGPRDFHSDMDFSTPNLEEALERHNMLKDKYGGNKVIIEEVTEIKFREKITAEQLENRIF